LKYFGRTIRDNPISYRGSGAKWANHLNKHNIKKPKTLEVYTFDSQEKATLFALNFSAENDIVSSQDWANLIVENALSQVENCDLRNIRYRMTHHNPANLEHNKEKKRSIIKARNLKTNQELIVENRKEFALKHNIPYTSIGWSIQTQKPIYETWSFQYVEKRTMGA
jgi:hypothetical protein